MMSVSTTRSFTPRYTPTRSARPTVAIKPINYARRRFMVAVLFLIAALAVVFSTLQSQAAGASAHAAKASFTYVYVAPGDTLWSIATKYAPDVDPQQEIIDIQNLNALTSAELVPGQRLALP